MNRIDAILLRVLAVAFCLSIPRAYWLITGKEFLPRLQEWVHSLVPQRQMLDPIFPAICDVAEDCPYQPDEQCGVAICENRVCSISIYVGPTEFQRPGDCKTSFCDLRGQVVEIDDLSDAYANDADRKCTISSCDPKRDPMRVSTKRSGVSCPTPLTPASPWEPDTSAKGYETNAGCASRVCQAGATLEPPCSSVDPTCTPKPRGADL